MSSVSQTINQLIGVMTWRRKSIRIFSESVLHIHDAIRHAQATGIKSQVKRSNSFVKHIKYLCNMCKIYMFSWNAWLFTKVRCSWLCLANKYSISQEICTRFLLCCALLWLYIHWFSHIHQAYFTDDCPSASKATLMNMDKYFMWIHYERLHNHNNANHNKTVCIFLGIYCMLTH